MCLREENGLSYQQSTPNLVYTQVNWAHGVAEFSPPPLIGLLHDIQERGKHCPRGQRAKVKVILFVYEFCCRGAGLHVDKTAFVSSQIGQLWQFQLPTALAREAIVFVRLSVRLFPVFEPSDL